MPKYGGSLKLNKKTMKKVLILILAVLSLFLFLC